MGLFETLFGTTAANEDAARDQPGRHEIYPDDQYTVAYAIVARRDELTALESLVNTDEATATPLEQAPLMQRALDDIDDETTPDLSLRSSGDEFVPDIRELIEHWDRQLKGPMDTVWWPVAADTRFRLYLHYLEVRADTEEDEFEFPDSVGHVHTLMQRALDTVNREDDAKLSVIHKRHIPWETPEENESEPTE